MAYFFIKVDNHREVGNDCTQIEIRAAKLSNDDTLAAVLCHASTRRAAITERCASA